MIFKELTFNDVLNSSNGLVTAGTESTAWALSAFFHSIATNPTCLEKLVGEIRSAFDSEDEICLPKAEKLSYLNACIKEALRLYPPLSQSLPRVVAKGGRVIAGRYIPEGVSL